MTYEHLSLSELRRLLDEKRASSVELTQYFLERSKKLNPSLNAFVTICEKEALEQARRADKYMASAIGTVPMLCGIPYAAKDLFCTQNIRTTAASKILADYVPPYDATVIARLKSEKAVLVGKTNLDEFAHGSSTETSAFGPTKNPWDISRMPGGSSGGSAAAVSAGLVSWALGTETGGSIRQPSSLCGVSGWKPTYGRVSRYGVIAMASSLDSPGSHAGTVADLVHIANTIAGHDPKDGTTGKEITNYKLQITNLRSIKIGIPRQYFVEGMQEEVRERVLLATKELEKLGAEIIEVDLPYTRYGSLVYAIVAPAEISSNLARYDGIRYGHVSKEADSLLEIYEKSRAEGFGTEAKRRILTGTYVLSAGYYDAYYTQAQKVRRLIVGEFEEVFKTVDLLAAPSSPNVAAKLGAAASDPLFGYIADQLNIPSSLAGLPALSLPCGLAKPADGEDVELPVGLQLIGPQWGEQTLFDVGLAFQAATEWHKTKPSLQ